MLSFVFRLLHHVRPACHVNSDPIGTCELLLTQAAVVPGVSIFSRAIGGIGEGTSREGTSREGTSREGSAGTGDGCLVCFAFEMLGQIIVTAKVNVAIMAMVRPRNVSWFPINPLLETPIEGADALMIFPRRIVDMVGAAFRARMNVLSRLASQPTLVLTAQRVCFEVFL